VLTIRKEQLAVFQKGASEDFENHMVSHVKQFFPGHFEQLGEAAVRDLIRCGIQKGASYNIEEQPDLCQFIDFLFVFGRDFDRDPALPWASSILNDPEVPGPSAKVYELRQAAAALQPPAEGNDA
jgi:hypothetical protein